MVFVIPDLIVQNALWMIIHIDVVEMKGCKWILETFQYEEKTISLHYTQIMNIEKGGE